MRLALWIVAGWLLYSGACAALVAAQVAAVDAEVWGTLARATATE